MVSISDTHRGAERTQDDAARVIVVVGLALGVVGAAHVYTDPEPVAIQVVELLLVGLPALAIVCGGYWVHSHRSPDDERWAVATWCVGGSLIGGLLVGGYIGAEAVAGNVVTDGSLLFVIALAGGGLIGLLGAIATLRSISTVTTESAVGPNLADSASLSANARTLAAVAADRNAWYVVRMADAVDDPVAVETVASRIAALEDEHMAPVYLNLIHVQLPKLVDLGLVEYDTETGTVRATARLPTVVAAGNELADLDVR